jgi:GNAT superfamily N-acetyltransferase
MRVPELGIYQPKDFDDVVALLEAEDLAAPSEPDELNGLALVARDEEAEGDERPVVAFVWALAAAGNPTAYVDYFVVRKDLRGTAIGHWLLGGLVLMLKQLGVRHIKTVVPPRFTAYLRMLRRRGADDRGAHHFLVVDLEGDDGKRNENHDHQPADVAG